MKKIGIAVAVVAVIAVFALKADDYGKSDAEKAFEAAVEAYERAETAADVDDSERQRRMLADANAKLDYVVRHLEDLTSDVDRGEAELLRAKVVLAINRFDSTPLEDRNPYTVEVLYHASESLAHHQLANRPDKGDWCDEAVVKAVVRELPLLSGEGSLTVVDLPFRKMLREMYFDDGMLVWNTPRQRACDLICEVPSGTKQVTKDEFWDRVEAIHKENGCEGANISLLDVEW